MVKICDRLIIGYDMSGDDEACLIVARKHGKGLNIINKFYGIDAEQLYDKLCENCDEQNSPKTEEEEHKNRIPVFA